MICANSNVNRSTFYDHFQDKFDLLSKIQNYHLNKYEHLLKAFSLILIILKNPEKVYKFFHIILKYIYRKKHFTMLFFISHPNKELVMEYIDITKQYYTRILGENNTTIQNVPFFITYTMSGQIGVILNWLRLGCQESPDEVASALLANTLKVQKIVAFNQ